MIVLIGTVLSLVPIAPLYHLTLQPDLDKVHILLLLFLPAAVLAIIADVLVLYYMYSPLRKLDTLDTAKRYAQNDDLSRAVVLLHNLPTLALARVFLCHAVVFTACYNLLTHYAIPWVSLLPGFGPSFWLANLTIVPLLPAVYEFFTLPSMIEREYDETLAYRSSLLSAWRSKIVTIRTGIRLILLVILLGVMPLMVLYLSPTSVAASRLLEMTICSFALLLLISFFVMKNLRSSTQTLLSAMRQIQQNKRGAKVHLSSADEFSQLAEGLGLMLDGIKQQTFIRDTFGKYVPKAVVEAVLRQGVRLQGERRHVAILLVDIHSFRSHVEKAEPTEIISTLNAYLSLVINVAQHYSGTVDKIVADRVLVVFGAPISLDVPTQRAMFAALEIRMGLAKLHTKLQRKPAEALRVAMSIHYGEVVAGHIGASERWEYSIVGDAVNVTYHIGELSKQHKADILVSAAARKRAGDVFKFGEKLQETARTQRTTIEVFPLLNEQTK
ncbi:MAG: adenylate/guanylate cyclase domain-containing protein [Ignavibacteria bacterium]|nr:adenylate/guanylate cyclase domain-containing protein [Ignavibacteria bacterium]